MHTFRYASTSLCGRMRHLANTLAYAEDVRDILKHVTNTIQIPKFCVCIKNLQRMRTYCLHVRHNLDVRKRFVCIR